MCCNAERRGSYPACSARALCAKPSAPGRGVRRIASVERNRFAVTPLWGFHRSADHFQNCTGTQRTAASAKRRIPPICIRSYQARSRLGTHRPRRTVSRSRRSASTSPSSSVSFPAHEVSSGTGAVRGNARHSIRALPQNGLSNCADPAFKKLCETLQSWFPNSTD